MLVAKGVLHDSSMATPPKTNMDPDKMCWQFGGSILVGTVHDVVQTCVALPCECWSHGSYWHLLLLEKCEAEVQAIDAGKRSLWIWEFYRIIVTCNNNIQQLVQGLKGARRRKSKRIFFYVPVRSQSDSSTPVGNLTFPKSIKISRSIIIFPNFWWP